MLGLFSWHLLPQICLVMLITLRKQNQTFFSQNEIQDDILPEMPHSPVNVIKALLPRAGTLVTETLGLT